MNRSRIALSLFLLAVVIGVVVFPRTDNYPYASKPDQTIACDTCKVCVFTGQAMNDLFGNSVSEAGDVNNDGYTDLIIGADLNDDGGINAGRAYVFSGLDCESLYVFTGEAANDYFGKSVSGAGDVNNDGYDDLIVGASGNDAGGNTAGRAYVYSGQTGGLLYTFTGVAEFDQFGFSVSGAGDVDNDGYADLIVGAYRNDAGGSEAGRVYVYSGQTGLLLHIFTGEVAGDKFGTTVSGAGDVDNDGYADLIVGASYNDAGGGLAGRAYVYSGQTGTLLHTFTGEAELNRFGNSVSGAGDVDNDGYADLIIGAFKNGAGGSEAGRAYVYSGQTGVLLYTFTGEAAADFFGYSVSGAGDVNNDGYADLVVGAYQNDAAVTDAGRTYVYSGQTGALLCIFDGEAEGDNLGRSVSGAGDVDNDGYADLVFGAFRNDAGGSNAGRAYVYSIADPDGDQVASPCDNCPDDYNPFQDDANGDGLGDACSNTPSGTDVEVQVDIDVTIGFSLITLTGETMVDISSVGPASPIGWIWPINPPSYYDITTTASYSGDVVVCITFTDPGGGETLEMLHYEGASWVSVPVIIADGQICGTVSSLSPFIIGYSAGCCVTPGDANNNGSTNIADAIYIINRVFGSPAGPAPPCCEEGDANGNGTVNIADAIYIINRVFGNPAGPAPICGLAGMEC